MANIHFYDVGDLDREPLERELSSGNTLAFSSGNLSVQTADADCEIASVFVGSQVSDAVLAAMPRLKLVACRSTGFNNVDLAAAVKRNVMVVNVPTYGENTVAEYAFGLLLALVRRLPQAINSVQQGNADHTDLRGSDLRGKTLGVVGAGRIGCHMAQIGRGFEMTVLAYDPAPVPERAAQYGFSYAELDDLLKQADFVSLHVPYLPSTKHLLDRTRLSLMKPSAFVVNTARGEIVDTSALVEALRNEQLAGAALDVFEGEKLVDVDAELQLLREGGSSGEQLVENLELDVLKRLPNVILTDHNAFNTVEALGRINDVTVTNIRQFLAGSPQNMVKAEH